MSWCHQGLKISIETSTGRISGKWCKVGLGYCIWAFTVEAEDISLQKHQLGGSTVWLVGQGGIGNVIVGLQMQWMSLYPLTRRSCSEWCRGACVGLWRYETLPSYFLQNHQLGGSQVSSAGYSQTLKPSDADNIYGNKQLRVSLVSVAGCSELCEHIQMLKFCIMLVR